MAKRNYPQIHADPDRSGQVPRIREELLVISKEKIRGRKGIDRVMGIREYGASQGRVVLRDMEKESQPRMARMARISGILEDGNC